jgi:hypothetical protein
MRSLLVPTTPSHRSRRAGGNGCPYSIFVRPCASTGPMDCGSVSGAIGGSSFTCTVGSGARSIALSDAPPLGLDNGAPVAHDAWSTTRSGEFGHFLWHKLLLQSYCLVPAAHTGLRGDRSSPTAWFRGVIIQVRPQQAYGSASSKGY